jgi:hypothetical protein
MIFNIFSDFIKNSGQNVKAVFHSKTHDIMKPLSTIILLFALGSFGQPSFAQRVEVDVSACTGMLNVLTAMKNGESKERVSLLLDSLLQTKPYGAMLRHYNRSWRPNHLPVIAFKKMILGLRYEDEYVKGENTRADQMLPFWRDFYNNLDRYQRNILQIQNTDISRLVSDAARFSQSWLPAEWKIPDFYLPIHPNGGSRAFAIDTIQGYDFLQLPRDTSGNLRLNELVGTIAHESHHLGLKTIYPEKMTASDSVAYAFLSMFSGEGTATKFINNYPGGCVPVVDSLKNSAFDNEEIARWWRKYSSEERQLFDRLVSTFESAYSGKMSDDELQKEISQFWLNGYISPVYFVGSEIFGAIYHAYGKDGLFTALKDLRQVFPLYNNALKRRQELLGSCYVIPDKTVQNALRIGRHR